MKFLQSEENTAVSTVPTSTGLYSSNIATAFNEKEGNFLTFTAFGQFSRLRTAYSNMEFSLSYAPPVDPKTNALDPTRVMVGSWYGVYPKGLYGLCWTNLDYFFNFLAVNDKGLPDLNKRQPDLVAIDGLNYDLAKGGYKIVSTSIDEKYKDKGKSKPWDEIYGLMVTNYGASNVWNAKETTECVGDTYASQFHSSFKDLSDQDKSDLKQLLMVMGAHSTPKVKDAAGKEYTIELSPGQTTLDEGVDGPFCGYPTPPGSDPTNTGSM